MYMYAQTAYRLDVPELPWMPGGTQHAAQNDAAVCCPPSACTGHWMGDLICNCQQPAHQGLTTPDLP